MTDRPNIDVIAFAQALSPLMGGEYIASEAKRPKAIIRFDNLKIDLHLSGVKKVNIWSYNAGTDRHVYGPVIVDPARSLENIGRNLLRHRDLFSEERVARNESYEQTIDRHIEQFCNEFPMFKITPDPKDRRRVIFQYSKDGVYIMGHCTPVFPGHYHYRGNPYMLHISQLDCDIREPIFTKLCELLKLSVG